MAAIDMETFKMLMMGCLQPTTTRLDLFTGQFQTRMSEVQRMDQRLSERMDQFGKHVADMKTDLDRQPAKLAALEMAVAIDDKEKVEHTFELFDRRPPLPLLRLS
ncbi:unnamed protein product [Prorocentrum cordatum]|uniref:Uncharacterized protein n=1 Tax=Prorocentrum cordatum TaxID=2364126 RepID=A0ABN9QVP9_9DINO|nr:unnamed protein product [Polarella glacialis]